jgi:hypothetical protein
MTFQPLAEAVKERVEVHLVREPHAPALQAEAFHLGSDFLSVEVEDVVSTFDPQPTGARLAEYEASLIGFPQRIRFILKS